MFRKPSTAMKIVFREAVAEDLAAIDGIFREELVFHSEIMPEMFMVPETVISEAWLKRVLESKTEFLVLAEDQESILGIIWYRLVESPQDSILKTRRFGYIQELMVTKSSQGQGLGRALVEHALKDLKARGMPEVELNIWQRNSRALQFYRRFGFETIQQRFRLKLD